MPYRDEFREAHREYYWSLPRVFVASAVGLVALCALGFGLSYFDYISMSFFAPRYEAVRRDVMIESRSYTEGTVRELYTMQRQYQSAKTDEERETIAAAARHEFSIFPKDRLPPDLRLFMSQVGG